MKLISRRSKLPYGGKTYGMGEPFEASDVHGRLLILVRVADLATADTGSYARADLQPQGVSGELPEHSVYVRRDMQAVKLDSSEYGEPISTEFGTVGKKKIVGYLTSPACRADLSIPIKRKRGRPPKVKSV